MPLLPDHIAVITGAGSGIGRAIALGYAREGARVVLLDRDQKAAAEDAKEIRDAGGSADSFALDVARREDCVAVAKQIADKVGQVSILVNNAGIVRRNGMLGAPISGLPSSVVMRPVSTSASWAASGWVARKRESASSQRIGSAFPGLSRGRASCRHVAGRPR